MKYSITLFIMIALVLSVIIAYKSYVKAKKNKMFDNEIVVSKDFYIKACELHDIMTNSNSREHQQKSLPGALSAFEREVMASRRINIHHGDSIELNRLY